MLKSSLIPAAPRNAGDDSAIEALQRIATQLRRGGANLPLNLSADPGTTESTLVRGLSLALCLVEVEIETIRLEGLRAATPAAPTPAARLGAFDFIEDLGPGELYVGLMTGADGEPMHHIILLPGEIENATWEEAMAWSEKAGGVLPQRAEQAILFGNAKIEFKPEWYWSSEQHAAGDVYAWGQSFYGGSQGTSLKSAGLRARAVRRLPI